MHAPSGPEVKAFRPADLDSIPGKDVSAAYGPGTELLFNLAARFSGLYVFKFISLLFDPASLLLLVLLLRARGEPLMRVLVYGWCPLVILAFAGSAHIDSAMIALLRTIPGGGSVRCIGMAWLVTLPLGLVNGLVF